MASSHLLRCTPPGFSWEHPGLSLLTGSTGPAPPPPVNCRTGRSTGSWQTARATERYKARARAVPSPGGREGTAWESSLRVGDCRRLFSSLFFFFFFCEKDKVALNLGVCFQYTAYAGMMVTLSRLEASATSKCPATSLEQGSWPGLLTQGHCSPYKDEAFLGFNTYTL